MCTRSFAVFADTLQWPKDTAIPFEQYVHLHSLAEPALLKALVQQALPATSPGNTASPEMSAAVHRLCQMLQALMGIPALCQKALIFTAHQADFVRRLWCSYLQVGILVHADHVLPLMSTMFTWWQPGTVHASMLGYNLHQFLFTS